MTHTPGPGYAPSVGIWTQDGLCQIATVGSREVVRSRRAYAQKHLGDTPTHNPAEMDRMRSDAALIAAAPSLLFTLRALCSHFPDPLEHGTGLAHSIHQARAAIARATGHEGTP